MSRELRLNFSFTLPVYQINSAFPRADSHTTGLLCGKVYCDVMSSSKSKHQSTAATQAVSILAKLASMVTASERSDPGVQLS